jgi:catechol 2,3-dioxygenase-like lactoylglutathione lyase family enzyme
MWQGKWAPRTAAYDGATIAVHPAAIVVVIASPRPRTRRDMIRVYAPWMAPPRMDNVLIVVDDLEAAKAFFTDLGMEVEGEATVEGASVDSLIGLDGVRATIVSMRTPDGHGRIELDKFHTPAAVRLEPVDAPVNALGIRRIMFEVEDLDALVARVLAGGAELIGDVVQYEDSYRLAYIRGPEGIVVGLSEQLNAREGEG